MRVKKKMEKKKGKNISIGWMAVLAVAVAVAVAMVFAAVMIPAASATIKSSSAIFNSTGDNSTVAAADLNDSLNISFVDDTYNTVWANITMPFNVSLDNASLVFNDLINVSYVNPSGEADTAATTVSSGIWGVNVTFDSTAAENNLTTVYLSVTARKEGNYSINVTTSSTKFSIPITIDRGRVLNKNTSVYYNTIQGAVDAASAGVIYVPDNFTTIQEAIDAASAGDTVFVRKETYVEHVTINKELSLIGEDKNTTIIDGDGSGKCIYITADYVNISGFTVQNGEQGIYLYRASNNVVNDNVVKSNRESGIRLEYRSNYNTVTNNIAESTGDGISICVAHRNQIRSNTIKSNTRGIYIHTSNYNQIFSNIVDSNIAAGIHMDATSRSNEIEDNTVSRNECGIKLVLHSGENIIINNTVTANRQGFYLHLSPENKIYHNNINNTIQAVDYTYKPNINYWDDGYPSGGNYWSDHTCHGNPSNGSEPYVIDDDSIDHYPFEHKDGWMGVNEPPVASFTYAPKNPIVNQTIEFNASASYDLDGSITSYEWDFGDGDNATEETVTHSYSSPEDYTVSLKVTDDDGATGSTNKTITVAPPPPPPVPTISVTTDKISYSPGETMNTTIDIVNPTEDSVMFQWYWVVPQFSVCAPVMSESKPAGYNDTLHFNFNFTIPDWGSKSFGSVFYVHLRDGSGMVLSQDAACWAYVPSGKGKGKIISWEDIAKGIEEGIKGSKRRESNHEGDSKLWAS